MEEKIICDSTGICKPFSEEEQNNISCCVFCGKELVKIEGIWTTWDYDLHIKAKKSD